MTLLVADPLPDAISERQACDVLDVNRRLQMLHSHRHRQGRHSIHTQKG